MDKNERTMRRTVIVVDDEPIIRLDLSQMLAELGFDVIAEGTDGFDAVELCRQKRPDIVLLDLEMPMFDGMTAAETILEGRLAACVVICTAFADEEFIARASRAGVSGYLVKPIEQRMLFPALEVAWAQGQRLAKSREETGEARRRLEESRLIEQAKGKLAKERQISESDAYREMQKTAMQKRTPLAAIARAVLERGERRPALKQDTVRRETVKQDTVKQETVKRGTVKQDTVKRDTAVRAKEFLMRRKNMSEQEAYEVLAGEAARRKVSVGEAARQILEREGIL